MTATVGAAGTVHMPGNPRVHGTAATVEFVAEWGYYLKAPAAATGQIRALFDEFVPAGSPVPPVIPGVNQLQARQMGYTGDTCDTCGSSRMVRNGSCAKCEECGSTSGCS